MALCLGWYIDRAVVATFPGDGASDFRWYYLAAHHILEGHSPYLAIGYIYPPLTAFLFTPLAMLDYVAARRVWWGLSQCFLLGAALVLWRRLGADWRSACVVAFIWASGGAAEESLGLGQIGPLLTLLLVAGSFPGRLEGAAISVGSAVKMIPGVLGVTLAMRRKWRTLLWTTGLTALLIVAPWAIVRWGLAGPSGPASTGFLAGTPTILSWSAPSVALRVLQPPGPDGRPPVSWIDSNLAAVHLGSRDRTVSLGVAALVMAAGLAALVMVARGRLDAETVPAASAALIALTLCAAPVCWTHYEVLQYPGAAILLSSTIRGRRWLSLVGLLVCWAFLYAAPVTVLRSAYAAQGSWPNAPMFLYFWTSISAAACLGVFSLALRELR